MIDLDFYQNTGPYTIEYLLNLIKAEPVRCDLSSQITGVAPLHLANKTHITFYHNPKYKQNLQETKADFCILHPHHIDDAPLSVGLLLSLTPYHTYGEVACLFYKSKPSQPSGIHPSANIAASAKIGHNCSIGPFCVIGEYVEIGHNCTIEAHSIIHPYVKMGNECYVGSHVVISHSLIGHHVYIKCGAKIGQKGFGFDINQKGHFSIPQLGRVVIEDSVEIGANTTVDRGASSDTILQTGVRIDNLCQIAHNVDVGAHSVIVSQTGISGSTQFGQHVIVGGQSGFAGHLKIGDHARIAAKSGVISNVPPHTTMMGYPAIKHRDFLKQQIHLGRLAKTRK